MQRLRIKKHNYTRRGRRRGGILFVGLNICTLRRVHRLEESSCPLIEVCGSRNGFCAQDQRRLRDQEVHPEDKEVE